MSRRSSVWGGVSLSLLLLGSCLLPDVGIDPALDAEQTAGGLQGGASGSGNPNAGAGGGSGSGSLPAGGAGAGGSAGRAGSSSGGAPAAMAGSSGAGDGGAGSGNMPPSSSGGGGGGVVDEDSLSLGELAALKCPDTDLLEVACGNYCATYRQACGDFGPEQGGPYDYEGEVACGTFCSAESQWALGTISTPDSVMCRCYHSVLAIRMGQTPHCFHAARVPSMPGGCQPMP